MYQSALLSSRQHFLPLIIGMYHKDPATDFDGIHGCSLNARATGSVHVDHCTRRLTSPVLLVMLATVF
eukprot:m.161274 g.161274  ORF g.161274 m.161274 type:complete len:68 (-) comp18050_c0_seq12:967-1170(-)